MGGAVRYRREIPHGKRYKFYANDATNSLHGGNAGFDRQIWDMREISGDGYKGVNFHFVSPDMAGGYPGNLDVSIDYKLCDGGMLAIKYRASTDKPTLCALTNHSYFNLSAGKSKDIEVYDYYGLGLGFPRPLAEVRAKDFAHTLEDIIDDLLLRKI